MAKKKFYVVWKGRTPGIYSTWAACQEQTKGYPGASFKSFPTKEAAEAAYTGQEVGASGDSYILDSISVDAACAGDTLIMEYQGVDTKTGSQIIYNGPFPHGTNNLGEFLALVDGIRYLEKKGEPTKPIYTDSTTALTWVRNKKVKTNLPHTDKTKHLWYLVEEALQWLRDNDYQNPLLKWDTKAWGEIKADFGRK